MLIFQAISPTITVLSWVRARLRKPPAEQILSRRIELRGVVRGELRPSTAGTADEVLVLNVKKHDDYPEPDVRYIGHGHSNWFKTEFRRAADRGIEFIEAFEDVVIRRGVASRPPPGSVAATRTVAIVGLVPYERIRQIDWAPDPAYGLPRIYVDYFRRRHDAFTDRRVYERTPSGSLQEMYDVHYVGEGQRRRRLRRHIMWTKSSREDRRQRKLRRDEYDTP